MDNHFLITDNIEIKKYNLYMTFSLAERLYAASAKNIVEVLKLPMLNIPEHLPEYIVGILNLRGNIINVLDLRNLLGIQPTTYTTDDCILVLSYNNITWGLIVDSVNNVVNISSDQISTTPYGFKETNTLISSVAKTTEGLLAILNLDFISKILTATLDEIQTDSTKEPFKFPTTLNLPTKYEHKFANDTKTLETLHKRAKELQKELDLSIEREKSTDQRFVTFLLHNEMYAISLQYIREFSKIINLSVVPCVPEFYIGLSNLRGEFIPVTDIKGFLGISKTEITDKTKIIFVKTSKMQIGIIVDEVFDIITVSSEKINKSNITQIDRIKYIAGEIIFEDRKVINIFDLEKFFQDERLIIEEAV